MNSTPSRFLATDPEEYEHFMGRWSRRLANPFLEFAGTKPGDRVLDVGCGTGILTSALAERGSKAVGIDASEAYVAEARRHRSHPEVTYELGDVRHLPYADSSFDACVSTLVLDIIPEFDSGRPGDAPRHAPWRGRRVRGIRFLGRLFRFRPSVRHRICA
jgi:SAM-dependent methyltransferase